ncbi:MAG: SAM-dependent methyltransferase [Deltaproteobacteria bacterium]|nr:SAM-dependent methyltransferase [Deltaproteobacteria bacterium]MBK8716858.1 SAM-dependent methyltransferase [Deltaproteobacteria bacterium]MBP7286964.1 SAM-dependent methyltransferase [Nannocystaceae bacterium]
MPTRLQALAAAVPSGSRVADVGTDHGQLLTLLVRGRGVTHAIGIDRSGAALRAAAGVTADARVELREGDGLDPIAPQEVDSVVLAGLGASTIVEILERARDRWPELACIVLQPRTQWSHLRRWIAAQPLTLRHESIVFEHGRAVLVCAVAPAPARPPVSWDDDDLWLGPLLRRAPTPTYARWLAQQLRACERALRHSQRGHASPPELHAQHHRIVAALAALPPMLAP